METIKRLSKEEFAQKMKEKRLVLFEKADRQCSIITEDEKEYCLFLQLLGELGYTITNTLLIQAQNTNAILLKDVARWREDGFYIRKGEKGIAIFEPSHSFTRRDGSQGVNYNIKYLFDVSQTSAEEYSEVTKPDLNQLEFAFKHKEKDIIENSNSQSQREYLIKLLKHICNVESDDKDDFLIESTVYTLAKKYSLNPSHQFAHSTNQYFAQLSQKEVKNKLNYIKSLFDTISKRIEHGLYVQMQEEQRDDN